MDVQKIENNLNPFKHISEVTLEKLISTLIVVSLVLLLRYLISRYGFRRFEDVKTRYRMQKTISAATSILLFFFVGSIWLEGIESFATYLGLLSAGLAVALKEPVTEIAGWGFIMWKRPFELGDRIQVGPDKGDIIDIGLFQFTILEIGAWIDAEQSTGRIIYIPNSRVFTSSYINYNRGFSYIWNEIPVLITFESNWKKTREILEEILEHPDFQLSKSAERKIRANSKRYLIHYTHLTPKVYLSKRDSGVLLTMRYLSSPRKRRGTEDLIWSEILTKFDQNPDINLAYNTARSLTQLRKDPELDEDPFAG